MVRSRFQARGPITRRAQRGATRKPVELGSIPPVLAAQGFERVRTTATRPGVEDAVDPALFVDDPSRTLRQGGWW